MNRKVIIWIGIVLITLVIAAIAVIIYYTVPWLAIYRHMDNLPDPLMPEITHAEFQFELVYEVNGEVRTVNDALICEFDGVNVDEGRGKTRGWKDYYKSNPDAKHIILYQMNDVYVITLGVGTAKYFMSEPGVNYVPDNPYISVFNLNTGYYLGGTSEEKELLEQCGFKIINWSCDSPVQNTFR